MASYLRPLVFKWSYEMKIKDPILVNKVKWKLYGIIFPKRVSAGILLMRKSPIPTIKKKENLKLIKKNNSCENKKVKKYYLRNDDVPSVTVFLLTILESKTVRVDVPMAVVVATSAAVARLLPTRVVVSMVRRVRMNSHYVHSSAFFFPKHLPIRILSFNQRDDSVGVRRPDLARTPLTPLLFAFIVLSSDEVDDEGGEGGDHGEHAGEGELGPRVLGEAGIGQGRCTIGKHVDESSGEDDTGSEGLRGVEDVAIGAEEPALPSDEGNGHAGHAGDQNRRDCDEFENL